MRVWWPSTSVSWRHWSGAGMTRAHCPMAGWRRPPRKRHRRLCWPWCNGILPGYHSGRSKIRACVGCCPCGGAYWRSAGWRRALCWCRARRRKWCIHWRGAMHCHRRLVSYCGRATCWSRCKPALAANAPCCVTTHCWPIGAGRCNKWRKRLASNCKQVPRKLRKSTPSSTHNCAIISPTIVQKVMQWRACCHY